MGKHKKFLKSEKAKVKLKGNKLKGPQNVTKTDFKVRKIILTEQLKNVQQIESGERKKHNINDVLARLKNSTSPEVISNLRDIILHQPEDFQKHLEAIIKSVANLSLSIEKNVRRDCFKIMDTICSQTSEFNLRPFFPILLTYLKCAMTHIKPAIQEDSLLMFDILLRNAPKLVASERDKIMPNYLDLVSKIRTENNPERTLSLQLGNKITNMKWRKSVLERLIVYLKCINSQQNESNSNVEANSFANEIVVNELAEFICNPYQRRNLPIADIEMPSLDRSDDFAKNLNKHESLDQIARYVHMIMPLMFETWMELKPTNETTHVGSIPQESAQMLKLIMDIQLELFSMIERNINLKQQFLKKYQDSFDKQILSNFPYVQNDDGSKRTQENGGERCIYQNLPIAFMFFQFSLKNQQRFSKYREKCFDFIEESILSWRNKDQEFNFLIKKLIRTLFSTESQKIFVNDSKRIFLALVRKCNVDQTTYDPKLALVCEIFEKNQDMKQGDSDSNLLSQMVSVLAEKEFVPVYLIKTMTLLCKKGNKTIIEEIEKHALKIVRNLQKRLKISGNHLDNVDNNRWKMEIANLLCWIEDKDVLMKLNELPKSDNILSVKIDQLISMKLSDA
ncbi:testis-expressed protein 10 [Chironomus tepperi]|uniref:testis-expressed protein 10 n=1 Tax=Chironomus tepperi TaxID=113505 RepID=UPI00391EF970